MRALIRTRTGMILASRFEWRKSFKSKGLIFYFIIHVLYIHTYHNRYGNLIERRTCTIAENENKTNK